ncbi:MAG: hypothetical protein ABWX65_07530, partial [Mycetocola sp.]
MINDESVRVVTASSVRIKRTPPANDVRGDPVTSTSPLFVTNGPSELGVRTMKRGSMGDIEIDEIFV